MFSRNTLARVMLFFLLTAGHAPAGTQESPLLDAEGLYRIITAGETEYNIYDTRGDVDYIVLHIAGSIHIPMREFAARIAEIPWDKLAILVSRNAGEAESAREMLIDSGYPPDLIKIFSENIDVWAGKGYPLESGLVFGC